MATSVFRQGSTCNAGLVNPKVKTSRAFCHVSGGVGRGRHWRCVVWGAESAAWEVKASMLIFAMAQLTTCEPLCFAQIPTTYVVAVLIGGGVLVGDGESAVLAALLTQS